MVVEKLQTVLIENDLRLREGPSGRRADEGGGVFGVDGSRSGGGGEREGLRVRAVAGVIVGVISITRFSRELWRSA